MRTLGEAFGLVRRSKKAYLLTNLAFYGLIAAGLLAAAADRELQQAVVGPVSRSLAAGGLAPIARLYASENVALAAVGTLAVNLIIGSFASMTLPSMAVPFSGLLIGGFRAILWGLIFLPDRLPASAGGWASGLLVASVLLLEGQGYVLTGLAAWHHARAWIRPATVGAADRHAGYLAGLRLTARLYPLIALTLAVAGVVEAAAAIVLIPRLT